MADGRGYLIVRLHVAVANCWQEKGRCRLDNGRHKRDPGQRDVRRGFHV